MPARQFPQHVAAAHESLRRVPDPAQDGTLQQSQVADLVMLTLALASLAVTVVVLYAQSPAVRAIVAVAVLGGVLTCAVRAMMRRRRA